LGELLAGTPLWIVLVVGAIVMVGAFVQASVGLGLGMLGAPLVALVAPDLVPTLLLLLVVPLSIAVVVADRHHIDWRVIGWALPARIPGTFLGVWLATTFPGRGLGLMVAVMVLVSVWFTFHTVEVRQTPVTLFGAGLAAGTTGTAVAVGGPPMAIVTAHRPPREVRVTLSLFFVVGSVFSLVVFAWQDALPTASLTLGVLYLPLLAVAYPLGNWANRRVPHESFRRAVLALCTISALVLLAKSLLG
jgi:uncharacterized membrane protein YfcA